MAFKIGQSVLYRRNIITSIGDATIEEWTITKVSKDGAKVWVNGEHHPEDCFFSAYFYPNTPESRAHLERGIEMSRRQRKEQDEYMSDTYKLLNSQTRSGER